MAKSKDHDDEPKHKHGHGPEHEGGHYRRRPREQEDSGDDPKRHGTIIERRWLGSPPPTAERYRRALRQWQNLPGAVVQPATDVTGPPEKPVSPNARPPKPTSAGKEGES
jgi:hypothetical protein